MRYWKKDSGGGGITPQMFGCTKMAVDEFILSADKSTGEYTINHSLGEKPKLFFILTTEEITENPYNMQYLNYIMGKDFGWVGTGMNASNNSLIASYIATNVGILNENTIIPQGNNGYFFTNGTPQSMSQTYRRAYYKAGVTYKVITMA